MGLLAREFSKFCSGVAADVGYVVLRHRREKLLAGEKQVIGHRLDPSLAKEEALVAALVLLPNQAIIFDQ